VGTPLGRGSLQGNSRLTNTSRQSLPRLSFQVDCVNIVFSLSIDDSCRCCGEVDNLAWRSILESGRVDEKIIPGSALALCASAGGVSSFVNRVDHPLCLWVRMLLTVAPKCSSCSAAFLQVSRGFWFENSWSKDLLH
jgi:hypothetical protein